MKTSMANSQLTDFDRMCLERIPPNKLREFHERAVANTKRIFEGDRKLMLPKGFCSHCATNALFTPIIPSILETGQITPLICDLQTGESLCASCWCNKKEREYCQEYLDSIRPKLDYEDFIRL